MALDCSLYFFDETKEVTYLTPNIQYTGTVGTNNNDVDYYRYEMLENETMTYNIRIYPHTTNAINVTLTLYKYENGELKVLGTSLSTEFYNQFIYDGTIGDYYFCLQSDYGVDYELEVEFTDYPFILFAEMEGSHGAAIQSFALPEPPPEPCLEPIGYFIIGGALPEGLTLQTGGMITGFIPEQDCLTPTDIKPSNMWRNNGVVEIDYFRGTNVALETACNFDLEIDPYVDPTAPEEEPPSISIDVEPLHYSINANTWQMYVPVFDSISLILNPMDKNGAAMEADLELFVEEMPVFLSDHTIQYQDIVSETDIPVGTSVALTQTLNYPVKIRAYLVNEPESYVDGTFYVCVINNWDTDLNLYNESRKNFEQRVFLRELPKGIEPNWEEYEEPPKPTFEEEVESLCDDNCLILPEFQDLVVINSNGICEPCPEDDVETGLVPIETEHCDPCQEIEDVEIQPIPETLCCVEEEVVEPEPELVEGVPNSCMEDYLEAMENNKICDPYACEAKEDILPDPLDESITCDSQCPPCEDK